MGENLPQALAPVLLGVANTETATTSISNATGTALSAATSSDGDPALTGADTSGTGGAGVTGTSTNGTGVLRSPDPGRPLIDCEPVPWPVGNAGAHTACCAGHTAHVRASN